MKFSGLSQSFTVVSLLMSLLIPISAALILKKKFKFSWKTIGIGALTWFVFAQILEGGMHFLVLSNTQIFNLPWAFVVYGVLSAALFEEGGRYMVMTYLMKKYRDWKDGVGFGIGHGGLESIMIGALGGVQVLILGALLNTGQLESLQLPKNALPSLITVLTAPSWVFIISGVERLFAFVMQIALSLLVMAAVRGGNKKYLGYTFGLHILFNFFPALYQAKFVPLWAAESAIALVGLVSLYYLYKFLSTTLIKY